LSTPEITYGIEYFQKSIKKHKEECFKLDTIWILKNDTEITNINDKKIEEAILLQHFLLIMLTKNVLFGYHLVLRVLM
jgi:hypothetical protein